MLILRSFSHSWLGQSLPNHLPSHPLLSPLAGDVQKTSNSPRISTPSCQHSPPSSRTTACRSSELNRSNFTEEELAPCSRPPDSEEQSRELLTLPRIAVSSGRPQNAGPLASRSAPACSAAKKDLNCSIAQPAQRVSAQLDTSSGANFSTQQTCAAQGAADRDSSALSARSPCLPLVQVTNPHRNSSHPTSSVSACNGADHNRSTNKYTSKQFHLFPCLPAFVTEHAFCRRSYIHDVLSPALRTEMAPAALSHSALRLVGRDPPATQHKPLKQSGWRRKSRLKQPRHASLTQWGLQSSFASKLATVFRQIIA